MISIEDCKDGYYYLIDARNADTGVFRSSDNAFIIARHKFGDVFLFPEFHWETGAPYGTAKPELELEQALPCLPWIQGATAECSLEDEQSMLDWIHGAEIRHDIEFKRCQKNIIKNYITFDEAVPWHLVEKWTDEATFERLKKWHKTL